MPLKQYLRQLVLSACSTSEEAAGNSHRTTSYTVGGTLISGTALTDLGFEKHALFVATIAGSGGTATLNLADGVAADDGTLIPFTEINEILIHNKNAGTVTLTGGTWAANPFTETLEEDGAIQLSNPNSPYAVAASETWILSNSGLSATTVVVLLVGK